jgi:hypothetical protein
VRIARRPCAQSVCFPGGFALCHSENQTRAYGAFKAFYSHIKTFLFSTNVEFVVKGDLAAFTLIT